MKVVFCNQNFTKLTLITEVLKLEFDRLWVYPDNYT